MHWSRNMGFYHRLKRFLLAEKYFKNYCLEPLSEHEREEKNYKRDGNSNFQAGKDDANHMD